MKNLLSLLSATVLSLLVTTAVHADNHAKDMPSEEEMKKMMELSMPGEHHKILDPLVGEWDYEVTYRMAEDAPEQVSKGESINSWILDGRFLEQKVSGTMDMGDKTQPFNGIGIIGYNNMKGEYQSTWIDNMNTSMMISTGAYDAEAKTITEKGHFSCPMKGEKVPFTSKLHFVSDTEYRYVMHDNSVADKPFEMMSIIYTKK